ncbi:MAG: DUF4236 domain-containing protein [Phycisphaerales bacterium]|jgi:hypothetical protein
MGFYFRKSVNVGPFRVNLSKSGIGYSVGGAGFRTGKSATGRKYTSFGIPGTGMGYRKTGAKAGCLPLVMLGVGVACGAAGLTTWLARLV